MSKCIHKLFNWNVPIALPSRRFGGSGEKFSWEDWRARMKYNHPIKYFIFESVPAQFGQLWHKVDMTWYWFKNVTYNKRHLLDLRQPKCPDYHSYRYGYADTMNKIVYANFKLLEGFVELELGGVTQIQKDLLELMNHDPVPEKQIYTMKEALRIYKWWKEDRLRMIADYECALNEWHLKFHSSEGRGLMEKVNALRLALEDEVDKHLQSIISIRQGLWI